MKDILGLVFSSMHGHLMNEITPHRCMGSVPVGGRYRLIDFVLSAFANSGIEDVGVITHTNYQSLMEHLGNGREWDLSRKTGGLAILPPHITTEQGAHGNRIEALQSAMNYIKASPATQVVIADCDMLFNADFEDFFSHHISSGADITMLYKKMPLAGEVRDTVVLTVNDSSRVTDILLDPPRTGEQDVFLHVLMLSKKLLEYLVADCISRNLYSFERDVLQHGVGTGRYKVAAYEYDGYVSRFSSLQTYYEANLALLDPGVRGCLFPRDRPIYTKIRDQAPVRYGLNSHVSNSLLADGCFIDGEVENSILFHGVTVAKGVKVKNSVIMKGTTIGEGSSLTCVITDKNVTIREGRTITGFKTYPVYITKGSMV